jgi:hypothetical protein
MNMDEIGCVVNSIESRDVSARPGRGLILGKVAGTALLLLFLIVARPVYAVETNHDATGDLMEPALHDLIQIEFNTVLKATLTIYVLGNAPFGNALDPIHGKTLKGKAVVVNFNIDDKRLNSRSTSARRSALA